MKKRMFVFGRFNPPHLGHLHMIDKAEVKSKALGCSSPPFILISGKKCDFDNPLDAITRKVILEKARPNSDFYIAGVDIIFKTPFDVIQDHINDKYWDGLYMTVGRDRLIEFALAYEKFTKTNIPPGRDFSMGFYGVTRSTFPISATQMRQWAREDNRRDYAKNFAIYDDQLINQTMTTIKRTIDGPKRNSK